MAGEQFVELINAQIKGVAEALKPSEIMLGVVKSASPLSVEIEGRLTVSSANLTLSALCLPFVTTAFKHRHDGGEEQLTRVTVWRGLQKDDKVRLLRYSGGKMYYVLDRDGEY